ncbi:MAG TPA: glycosyltransferase [Verrucomicrobiae bacterium]
MKKKIQVLHVVLSLDPGGMENGVVNLVNGLRTEDLEIKVCCITRAGAFAARLPADKQPVVLNKPPGFSKKTVNDLREVIRATGPAILHTHNHGTLIYTVLGRPFGGKWPILHGEHAEFTKVDLTLKRRLQRWAFFQRVDRLVPVSVSLGEHLVFHGAPKEKIYAINNGVDATKYSPGDSPAAKRALGLPENALIIGMVGRFGAFKRHEMLVNAFNNLKLSGEQPHLLLVGGGGPEETRVRQVASNSPVKERIHLAGYQSDPSQHYRAMDLLVVPSLKEGMSNAALEAMATGVPVLCHTSCGHADILTDGQNGFVRGMESDTQLTGILSDVMADRNLLKRAGLAGRDYVVQHLSLERMRERYAGLYRETARKWGLA